MHSDANPDPARSGSWIAADWPAPAVVRAGITTRLGGVSAPPRDSLNLASHVGDDPAAVIENRARLVRLLDLPAEPTWLNQQHGSCIVDAGRGSGMEADASYTRANGIVCAVLVADCIPLLLTDDGGTEIAAVHVGWRGLCGGIAAAAIARFRCGPSRLLAWIGPHISATHYEVGNDVRDACQASIAGAETAFVPAGFRWRADLAALLKRQLGAGGLHRVSGGDRCTYRERELFFSHRRDRMTGRMAALIWLDTVPGRARMSAC